MGGCGSSHAFGGGSVGHALDDSSVSSFGSATTATATGAGGGSGSGGGAAPSSHAAFSRSRPPDGDADFAHGASASSTRQDAHMKLHARPHPRSPYAMAQQRRMREAMILQDHAHKTRHVLVEKSAAARRDHSRFPSLPNASLSQAQWEQHERDAITKLPGARSPSRSDRRSSHSCSKLPPIVRSSPRDTDDSEPSASHRRHDDIVSESVMLAQAQAQVRPFVATGRASLTEHACGEVDALILPVKAAQRSQRHGASSQDRPRITATRPQPLAGVAAAAAAVPSSSPSGGNPAADVDSPGDSATASAAAHEAAPSAAVKLAPEATQQQQQQQQQPPQPDAAAPPPSAAPASCSDGAIVPMDADSYAKLYPMYNESIPHYQAYKREWEQEQLRLKAEREAVQRETRTAGRRLKSRSIYSMDVLSPRSDSFSPTPSGVCSPLADGGAMLVAGNTALCLLIESSRPASVRTSPLAGYRLVREPQQAPLSPSLYALDKSKSNFPFPASPNPLSPPLSQRDQCLYETRDGAASPSIFDTHSMIGQASQQQQQQYQAHLCYFQQAGMPPRHSRTDSNPLPSPPVGATAAASLVVSPVHQARPAPAAAHPHAPRRLAGAMQPHAAVTSSGPTVDWRGVESKLQRLAEESDAELAHSASHSSASAPRAVAGQNSGDAAAAAASAVESLSARRLQSRPALMVQVC